MGGQEYGVTESAYVVQIRWHLEQCSGGDEGLSLLAYGSYRLHPGNPPVFEDYVSVRGVFVFDE
jgi:hypothetical protein